MKDSYQFCGVPLVRIVCAKQGRFDGFQVQTRDSEESTDWKDVEKGWFYGLEEALEEAPLICEF